MILENVIRELQYKIQQEEIFANLNDEYTIIHNSRISGLRDAIDIMQMVINDDVSLMNNEKEESMWTWNKNNDDYWNNGTYKTKEEAIEEAKNCGFTSFYVGECEIVPLRTDADPDRIMEELDELYHDDSGSEDYIYDSVSSEDRKWLEDKLSELMSQFNKRAGIEPTWYRVFSEEFINLQDRDVNTK